MLIISLVFGSCTIVFHIKSVVFKKLRKFVHWPIVEIIKNNYSKSIIQYCYTCILFQSKDMPPPTPMPLKNLAPPPSGELLFGNISKLKDQYTKEKSEFEKVQEMNKQRIDQGLDEKLAARRNRRKRAQTES